MSKNKLHVIRTRAVKKKRRRIKKKKRKLEKDQIRSAKKLEEDARRNMVEQVVCPKFSRSAWQSQTEIEKKPVLKEQFEMNAWRPADG